MTTPFAAAPAAIGIGAYGRDNKALSDKASRYLRDRGLSEALLLAFNGGRTVGKGLPLSRWNWWPVVAVTTSAVRVLSKPGTEEIIELPLAEIVWAKTTSDGFAVALTSGRSLRLITGAINAEKMMFAFLGAVAQALGQHGGDVRVPAQRPVLLQGTHQGGYGTGIAVDVPAVLAVDGMSVSVLTPGHGYCRGLDDLLGVQLGGGGEYTTGGGWFGGGFGVQGALEGAALASVMNWLTTRRHMDTVLRLVYADAEATFGVTTHAPGRLELELAALLAWLRGGAAPGASTLGLHALASRSGRSEAPLSGESRFCAGCGEPRQVGGAYCAGCGRPF